MLYGVQYLVLKMDAEDTYVLARVASAREEERREEGEARKIEGEKDEGALQDNRSSGSAVEEARIKSDDDSMPEGVGLGLMIAALCLSISLVSNHILRFTRDII